MRLSSGRRAPRLMSLLPARGGRASSGFFGIAARLRLGSISAPADLHIGRLHFSATRRVKQSRLARMNSNLVETSTGHTHLQSITTLAFAFRGHAGV
jgi:hypothetical protein